MASPNATYSPGPEWEGYDITPLFSPFYWGTTVSLILSGITILQAYMYFPSKDKLGVQLVAALMIMLDIASTALVSEAMYKYLIPTFGSLVPFEKLALTLSSECYLAATITLLSHLYFAWQIYIVTTSMNTSLRNLLSGSVIVLSILSFGAGLACATIMVIDPTHVFQNKTLRLMLSMGIGKGLAVIVDILYMVSLCYFLESARTGVAKRTNAKIKILISYVIQRGILVTPVQLCTFILLYNRHQYWVPFHLNVTKLYANTFFAMLNGRHRLQKVDEQLTYGMSMDEATAKNVNEGKRNGVESHIVFARNNTDTTNSGTEEPACV